MEILLISALLPGILFVIYLYRLDHIEKEPISLIIKLLFAGVASAVLAYFLEVVLEDIIMMLFDFSYSLYFIVDAFVVVGLSEEFAKFKKKKKNSWYDHNFNCAFDGVLYSALAALGFAMSENILYVFSYGLPTALTRAFTSIPAHLAFGIIMGIFYSNAKMAQYKGDEKKCRVNLVYSIFFPAILHGFYDYCLFDGSDLLMVLWGLTIIIIYIVVFKLVREYAKNDTEFY